MEYIDLTHTLKKDMPVFPGDKPLKLKEIATFKKDGYSEFQICCGMHVGTHLDAPYHMLKDGRKLSQYPVDHFFGPGIMLDARGKKIIDSTVLNGKKLEKGRIALIYTGFEGKYGKREYYENYPEIDLNLAKIIAKSKVKIIGLDCPSPDRHPYEIHKILLGKNILIIENLTNLEKLLGKNFNIIALPAKFETEAAPVRVIAQIY